MKRPAKNVSWEKKSILRNDGSILRNEILTNVTRKTMENAKVEL